ncbi:unnamed protein product [Paramecium pentaurelia]|uniref:Uncharacterized protein n=1 Tax=Paramecium pentaurelia TaxID=43138 RepID=A0A8S1TPM1_9CILI|nr:unnamed protein product [Paramecium pentaurelia]
MNIYKTLGKVNCFQFSTSATSILNKFGQNYYIKNYGNTYNQKSILHESLKIGKKTCNLVGLPRQGDQNELTQNISNIILKDKDKTNFLIQMDPSPYLFAKRQLYKQYHSKVDPILNDNLFEQLPTLPIDTNELKIDLPIFDSIHLIKTHPMLSPEQKQDILGFLNGEKQGYFQQAFQTIQEQKDKQQELTPQLVQESDDMSKRLAQLLEITLLYGNQQSNVDFSQFGLFQALYMSVLKGSKVYMIGLSQIYQRIYIGIIMQLPDVQEMFREFCEESLLNKYNNLNYFFEFTTMLWIEKAIEFYMLYSINRYLKYQEEDEVTVFIDSLHFDPLKSAIQQQKNKFVSECDNSYFYEFQYPSPEKQETDEQMLEKHAIFDCLLEHQIWKEPCISNPFPYLSINYNQMNTLEQKEIQSIFYKYHSKYSMIVNQLKQQNKI